MSDSIGSDRIDWEPMPGAAIVMLSASAASPQTAATIWTYIHQCQSAGAGMVPLRILIRETETPRRHR
jgi:hypothetical protein